MEIRRVATGHDKDGKAVFVSDEMVAPVTLALLPGSEFHRLWGADATVTFPDDGARPEASDSGSSPFLPMVVRVPLRISISRLRWLSSRRSCRDWRSTSSRTTRG